MPDMPKVAHRSESDIVLGYINAAREALRKAVYFIGNDNPAHDHINDMLEQTMEIEREFKSLGG